MDKIQRYGLSSLTNLMYKNMNGGWVLQSDHEKALAEQREEFVEFLKDLKENYIDAKIEDYLINEKIISKIQELEKGGEK